MKKFRNDRQKKEFEELSKVIEFPELFSDVDNFYEIEGEGGVDPEKSVKRKKRNKLKF
ncbi:hypothetical protein [Neptuniibacter sp. QD48_11]|uniref:hypothetical protein n=1 Tax=Neptuniibacter sp. QD48_11 TaxID=3398211 RepID=UPI0039F47EA5